MTSLPRATARSGGQRHAGSPQADVSATPCCWLRTATPTGPDAPFHVGHTNRVPGQVTANQDPLTFYTCTQCIQTERAGELNTVTVTATSRLTVSGLTPFQVAERVELWDLLWMGRHGFQDAAQLELLRSPIFVQELDIGTQAYLI